MSLRCRFFTWIGLMVLAPTMLSAQAGTIGGKITDRAGAAIPGVVITIEGTGLRAASNSRGEYRVQGVPTGSRVLRARGIGYAPFTVTLDVAPGQTVTTDVVLERAAVLLDPINVTVGSRAVHLASEELAVPVDVIGSEQIARVATTETNQVLQTLAPSVNFPRQSVSDASDIVRPFTMRGLNPDHTLVLLNGVRRHRTALVHIYNAGMGAGGSGVDMNAIPTSAIERMEILRDGAAAQYGSDAISGVVNVVLRSGEYAPFLNTQFGRHVTQDYPDDGNLFSFNGGVGLRLGRGSINFFAEYRDRDPTNRAGADNTDQIASGDADVVDENGKVVQKNNAVPQPNHHWGDGKAKDILSMVNLRLPLGQGNTEAYAFGGWSHRKGTGNGYRRVGLDARNWPVIYPLGYLPQFEGKATDWSAAGGLRGAGAGWTWDLGLSYGYDSFDYDLSNTMNVSLGPCLTTACAPGLDGILGTSDDPGIPNKTAIFAGTLALDEFTTSLNLAKPFQVGLRGPLTLAVGGQFRRESYEITAGEPASYIQGGHLDRFGDQAPPGSQVFPGFRPEFAGSHSRTNVGGYVEAESELAANLLANAAGRYENYSDFGDRLTGKLALRLQPSERFIVRAAASTGFRAPALSQSFYASTVTNFARDANGQLQPYEVGIFPVNHPASLALGARPLKDETSLNLSAGFAVSPSDAFTLTADVYFVRINDRIMLTNELSGDDVEQILAGAGVEARAARYFTNALDTETKGLDLTANWAQLLGPRRLDFTAYATFNRNRIKEIRVPPEIASTDATFFDPYLEGGTVAIERERPEWRAGLSARMSAARYDGLLNFSYFGKFESALFGYAEEFLQQFGGKLLVDVEAGYRFAGQLRFALGARNLFDTYPDRLSADNGFGLFLHPPGSPFGYNGRFVYARLEWVR
jgi:iron complex outermembrane recepter protein